MRPGGKGNYRTVRVGRRATLGVDAHTDGLVRVHLFVDGGDVPAHWPQFVSGAAPGAAVDGTPATLPRIERSASGRISLRYEWRAKSGDYASSLPRAAECARLLAALEIEKDPATRTRRARLPNGVRPAIRRPDADAIVKSAKDAMRAVLESAAVSRAHKYAVIDRMLWAITEEPWGKYTTPFRSMAAVQERDESRLRHEHVYERNSLANMILDDPTRLDECSSLAIACVVTVDEEKRLNGTGGRTSTLQGWARYRALGIQVVRVNAVGEFEPIDLGELDP